MIFLSCSQNFEFRTYKRRAIKTAKELFYDNHTVKRIREAKTELEIDRIMHDARHKFLKDNWERG